MRTILALLVLALPFAGLAAAQDKTWVGKTVLVKKAGIKIGHTAADGKQVYVATLGLTDYQVIAEDSGWIRVRAGNGNAGWFDKVDAVPLDAADAYFTGRIQANPNDTLSYYLRGFARLRHADIDSAIKDYGEVIRLRPTDNIYAERGILWARKGDYDKAIADFAAAVRICQQITKTVADPKMLTPDLSELPRRQARIVRLLKMDQVMGMMMSQMVNEFGKMAFAPKMADYLTRRGGAWAHKGDYNKAIADCTEALRLDGESARAYRTRGYAWQAKQEFGKALTDFESARRLEPRNDFGLASMAWILATAPDPKLRDGKRAVELAKEAQAIAPKSATCLDTLAAACAEAGDFAQAVRWQEQALQDPLLKNNADARRRLELYKKSQPYRQE